jgi:hypothetical protein
VQRECRYLHGVNGFLDFVRDPVFQRKWICFRPQVRGSETLTLLGPLERANLSGSSDKRPNSVGVSPFT